LRNEQIIIAKNIYNYLIDIKKNTKKNIKLFKSLILQKELIKLGASKVDYLELINIEKLEKPKNKKDNYNIFVAYYLKNIRLIDNF
jgi:pantothenate synthetase